MTRRKESPHCIKAERPTSPPLPSPSLRPEFAFASSAHSRVRPRQRRPRPLPVRRIVRTVRPTDCAPSRPPTAQCTANSRPRRMQDEEYSLEELQEFAQAFKMFDRDSSGTMNIKELGIAMRTLGLNPTEEELLNIVNEFDVDGNNKLDFGEFCKLMKATNKETDESLIRLAFKVFDKDGNGYITAQEFRHIMTTMGEKFEAEEEFVASFAVIVHDNDKSELFAEPPPALHHGKK
ncbi:EF hand [Aphelenchoides fujianensis]|nr:EF hand [Aphelenchoides fujianensis]